MIYERLSNLDPFIRSLLYVHRGYVVGSGAEFLINQNAPEPRDWDIIIPLTNWNKCMKGIPKGSPSNTFGGVKVTLTNGDTCDIWAQEIADYCENISKSVFYVCHPLTLVEMACVRQSPK